MVRGLVVIPEVEASCPDRCTNGKVNHYSKMEQTAIRALYTTRSDTSTLHIVKHISHPGDRQRYLFGFFKFALVRNSLSTVVSGRQRSVACGVPSRVTGSGFTSVTSDLEAVSGEDDGSSTGTEVGPLVTTSGRCCAYSTGSHESGVSP